MAHAQLKELTSDELYAIQQLISKAQRDTTGMQDGDLETALSKINYVLRVRSLAQQALARVEFVDRAVTDDERAGMAWWNGLTESQRGTWLKRSHGWSAAEAWEYFKSLRTPAGRAD